MLTPNSSIILCQKCFSEERNWLFSSCALAPCVFSFLDVLAPSHYALYGIYLLPLWRQSHTGPFQNLNGTVWVTLFTAATQYLISSWSEEGCILAFWGYTSWWGSHGSRSWRKEAGSQECECLVCFRFLISFLFLISAHGMVLPTLKIDTGPNLNTWSLVGRAVW